jgi:trehalose 6-phosphate phosphatase
VAIDLDELAARAAETALCFDFDGTLAPIVEDPDTAAALPGTVELLGRLAGRFAAVALISGRPASFLAASAEAPGLRYVGLYGMEEIAGGEVHPDPEAESWRPAVAAAKADLEADEAVTGSGAFLEDKGLTVGVHMRRVADPGRWAAAVEAAARGAAERHGLAIAPGKLVWELRPPVERTKGDAVRRVADEAGAAVVVMAGDDLGDVHAFDEITRMEAQGRTGLRIAVRSEESPAELLDAADLVVDGPEGLRELLDRLDG